MVRTGFGFDFHTLAKGRKLIMGGIEIEYDRGLQGHADADVVCHAVADALLGAAGLGDIGALFPDSDETLNGMSGPAILIEIRDRLAILGYKIANVDIAIISPEPDIIPAAKKMRIKIADTLMIADADINVKIKSQEFLGFAVNRDGIAVMAVATLEKT